MKYLYVVLTNYFKFKYLLIINMDTISYLRSFKVSKVSIFDLIGSYLVFYILISIFGFEHSIRNYLLVMPIALIAHVLVNQETTLTKQFLSPELNFFKIFMIINVILIIALSS
jgi:hypothetical protein